MTTSTNTSLPTMDRRAEALYKLTDNAKAPEHMKLAMKWLIWMHHQSSSNVNIYSLRMELGI